MSISPEIKKIPYLYHVFAKAGLARELISGVVRGETDRNLAADARRLSAEFDKCRSVSVNGVENISEFGGCLMVFNHANVDILLPAFLRLITEINNVYERKNPVFVMGSEIPIFGRFDRYPLPGSLTLLRRFHHIYPNNIISAPTTHMRRDYAEGRVLAARCVIKSLKNGNIVVISPEGHVEIDNQISPLNTFHAGSGQLAIIATRHQIPIKPLALWEENHGTIKVEVGGPFYTETKDSAEAVNDLMRHVANLLPGNLRGPFRE